MTILGAYVIAPDLAVCWADSESFTEVDNRSTGMRTKLSINAAGFAFVMTGWAAVASRASTCVMDAPDFVTALEKLPLILRRASEQIAIASREPDIYGAQHAALIGFDRAGGGMIAYRMTAQECFVPQLDHGQAVPRPAMQSGTLLPTGLFEVRMIADRQMNRLREFIPHARGGPLHAAVIRPDNITVTRLCDLAETAAVVAPASVIELMEANV